MDEIKGKFKIWNGTCMQASVLETGRQTDVATVPTNLACRLVCMHDTLFNCCAAARYDRRHLKLAGPAPTNHTVMLH